MRLQRVAQVGLIALLGACASAPQRDGPPEKAPAELANLRDAEPRVEPIRSGGPNRPYEVFGRDYVPITHDVVFRERGLASWYGRKFHGRRTANGEVYDMFAMTAAHPTLPIPSYARVTNPANGRVIIVRVNDRGPFHAGRIVDLSYAAAFRLDLLRGVAPVVLERLTFNEIRNGAWRRASSSVLRKDEGAASAEAETTVRAPGVRDLVPTASPGSTGSIDPTLASLSTVAPGSTASNSEPPPAVPEAPRQVSVRNAAPGGGFWIQLGAFRLSEGALAFERRVAAEIDWLEPVLIVFRDASLYRLQAGPYETLPRAQAAAERIRELLKLVPVIVERR